MTPAISFIVPVFNAERSLDRCLDSIRAQTLPEIEIICVNDGSTDDSSSILARHEKDDRRLKVLDIPNSGPGGARNAALPHVNGEYLAFVDADDVISSRLAVETVRIARREQSQVVLFYFDSPRRRLRRWMPRFDSWSSAARTTPEEKLPLLDYSVVWNKLCRTDFWLKEIGRFPGIGSFVDVPVHYKTIIKADRIDICPDRLYRYYQDRGTVSHRNNKQMLNVVAAYEIVRRLLAELEAAPVFWEHYRRAKLYQFYNRYRRIDKSLKPLMLAEILKNIDRDDREYLKHTRDIPIFIKDFYREILDGSFFAALRNRFHTCLWTLNDSLRGL